MQETENAEGAKCLHPGGSDRLAIQRKPFIEGYLLGS